MITLLIFIHFEQKYYYLNSFIKMNLINTNSSKLDYLLSKYFKNSLITINIHYVNPN